MEEYSDNGFDEMMKAAGMGPMASRRGDDALSVRFFIQPVRNEQKSAAAGRHIYEDVEMIEIQIPGDRDQIRHPVTEKDKSRFHQKYQSWKAGNNEKLIEGTPLKEWPYITASQIEELRFFGVRSVEQFASIPDVHLQKMGPYMQLRQQARDWLEASKDNSVLIKLRDENQSLTNRVTTLEKMLSAATNEIRAFRGEAPVPGITSAPAPSVPDIVAAVMAAMEAAKPPRKKPGPKPKMKATEQ